MPPTLFLIDPAGGRYRLMSGGDLLSGTLESWSGDGSQALLWVPNTASSGLNTPRYDLLDLKHGTSTPLQLPAGSAGVSFSRPSGLALLVAGGTTNAGPPSPVRRYSLSGSLQLDYPLSYPQAGTVNGSYLEAPDGTLVMLATAAGFELVNNDGTPNRFIAMSSAAGSCHPTRWWSPTVALAACIPNRGVSELWLVPTDGTPPTQLTATRLGDTTSDNGNLDGWKLSTGTYVQVELGCSALGLAKLLSGGLTTPVTVPALDNTTSIYVSGSYGNRLALTGSYPCAGGPVLAWYDTAADTTTLLLGGPINAGSVGSALLFGEDPAVL